MPRSAFSDGQISTGYSVDVRCILLTIRFLAESESFKVYSIYESVYLKVKPCCRNHMAYEKSDECIASVYGDPDSALISFDEDYIAIGGCGLNIYNIQSRKTVELFNGPDDIIWTEGVYQSAKDQNNFFRFTAHTIKGQLAIHRVDTQNQILEVLR